MSLLMFLGLRMIFLQLPDRTYKTLYRRSFRIMGIAFLLVPISCFAYTQENQLDLDHYIAPAINLSVYFATFILMSIAFLTLLGKRLKKTIMVLSIVSIVIFPIPLWVSIIVGGDKLIETVKIASYTYFITAVISILIIILSKYDKIYKSIESSDSFDDVIRVNWVSKSIMLLIGLSIVCAGAPLFFTFDRWLRFIFMLYGVLCYLYIYHGYHKMFMSMTEKLIEVNVADCTSVSMPCDDCFEVMRPEVTAKIRLSVEKWIAERGYTQKGCTINDVAKIIGTNRTYLSKYINTAYSCSFKSLVTHLRVEEAKRLMKDFPELSVTEISEQIGFASVESFSHIFARYARLSPSKWCEKIRR